MERRNRQFQVLLQQIHDLKEMLRQDDEPEDDEDEDSCGEPADNRDSMELENEA